MPTDNEITAAVQAMLDEDPIVMRMLNPQEQHALAAAALRGAEKAREEAAKDESPPRSDYPFVP